MNASTPLAAVKGANVIPDRCRMKPPLLHARSKDARGIGFPFDMTDHAVASEGSTQSFVEAPSSGT